MIETNRLKLVSSFNNTIQLMPFLLFVLQDFLLPSSSNLEEMPRLVKSQSGEDEEEEDNQESSPRPSQIRHSEDPAVDEAIRSIIDL